MEERYVLVGRSEVVDSERTVQALHYEARLMPPMSKSMCTIDYRETELTGKGHANSEERVRSFRYTPIDSTD